MKRLLDLRYAARDPEYWAACCEWLRQQHIDPADVLPDGYVCHDGLHIYYLSLDEQGNELERVVPWRVSSPAPPRSPRQKTKTNVVVFSWVIGFCVFVIGLVVWGIGLTIGLVAEVGIWGFLGYLVLFAIAGVICVPIVIWVFGGERSYREPWA